MLYFMVFRSTTIQKSENILLYHVKEKKSFLFLASLDDASLISLIVFTFSFLKTLHLSALEIFNNVAYEI